jgi:hypothetical protein
VARRKAFPLVFLAAALAAAGIVLATRTGDPAPPGPEPDLAARRG